MDELFGLTWSLTTAFCEAVVATKAGGKNERQPRSLPLLRPWLWLYTDKLNLWLYNGKSLSTLRTNWVCDYTTANVYQHWQTEIVIIQRQKFINTADKLSLWLYNGKSLSTLRTNWVCDYTTAKVYQHCGQTEFVIIQRQKFINTDKLKLWLYNRLYNRKSLWTQINQLSLWL